MYENRFDIDRKFGDNKTDIDSVYVLASKNNCFDVVYIKYNNNKIRKINKPKNESYQEFASDVSGLLKDVGATNENKNDKWYVLTKNNNLGIDFNILENNYQNQKISDNIINLNVESDIKKKKRFKISKVSKIEELEDLEDDNAIYRVKLIKNILGTVIFSLLAYSIAGNKSLYYLKYDLFLLVDSLFALSAIVDGLLLYQNKKMRKNLKREIKKMDNI